MTFETQNLELDTQNFSFHWCLDPQINFLNHGSYGACLRPVLEQQQAYRTRLEQEPVRFLGLELEALLDAARQELAAFVGANSDQLVFVPNATTGVNTVLRSLSFRPGDELLTTNHEYNASCNALKFTAAQTGATVVIAEIPFPLESIEQITEAVLSRVSERTKLVLLDHITSQTALIFPIRQLIQQLTVQGIEVLIDGAHAPGMVPLNLQELGVAYYTGNCHKWLCAPKGAAFLYVRQDKQDGIRPLVISHGANSPRTDRSRFHLEFDWVGTADPTAYLCVPTAIQCLSAMLPGGWPALISRNRAMTLSVRQLLCQQLQVALPCPDELIGSMATIPLPAGSATAASWQTALFERFMIEIPVIPWRNERLIRISVQLYNNLADYERLVEALKILHAEEQRF
ncbi:MAG: aminotransferase class V-fold PLP-dependent enzyme [Elainella sp. C42_A2020_010]|nr:aminotransferase class V-fold PLP-dependent enzyme [Elainella sp. C42_A2020_010]